MGGKWTNRDESQRTQPRAACIPRVLLVLTAVVGLTTVASVTTAAVAAGPWSRPRTVESPLAPSADSVRQLAQVTGPGSINATDTRWGVNGTDLGHTFWYRGALYMVFGDTFGANATKWRSNTMARIATADPASLFRFTSMISGPNGAALQLLSSLKVDGVEKTVIPTNGISVGGRMYLHFMSVRQWDEPGHWDVNYSGLAYSDDGGHTWTKAPSVRWGGASNFAQAAMVASAGYVYMFGIPAGRWGSVQVARVKPADLLEPGSYRYWSGRSWTASPSAAAIVVPAPVGELSVRWSSFAHRWLMMYLDESRHAIVMRSATRLTGPWSAEQIVTTASTYPDLYAPFMIPIDTGPDVYFTMSEYGPYEVYLMKLTLGRRS